jgi:hypothetical protein
VSSVTVPRPHVTRDEVIDVLSRGLGPRYHVASTADPEVVIVQTSSAFRAYLRIVCRGGVSELRVRPGGLVWNLPINTLGIARKVNQVLRESPALGGSR